MLFSALSFTLFFILIGALLSIIYWSLKNGISPMPTTPYVRKELMQILPDLNRGKIAELGSGWGSLIIPLAKHYPDCHIVGYETSPIPYLVSRLRLKWMQLPNVSLFKKDFLEEPLDSFNLVICYLYPGGMQLLSPKLKKELPHGTWIVSNTFALPGWDPIKNVELCDLYHTHLYLYRQNRT